MDWFVHPPLLCLEHVSPFLIHSIRYPMPFTHFSQSKAMTPVQRRKSQNQQTHLLTHNFPSTLSASLRALSPSTSTHHPSYPAPPSAATQFSKPSRAYPSTRSSKVPGCNHTLLTPSPLASSRIFCVTRGGVMIETPVEGGSGSCDREGRVLYVWMSKAGHGGYAFMVVEVGLIGVTGRVWCVYHVKTGTWELVSS